MTLHQARYFSIRAEHRDVSVLDLFVVGGTDVVGVNTADVGVFGMYCCARTTAAGYPTLVGAQIWVYLLSLSYHISLSHRYPWIKTIALHSFTTYQHQQRDLRSSTWPAAGH